MRTLNSKQFKRVRKTSRLNRFVRAAVVILVSGFMLSGCAKKPTVSNSVGRDEAESGDSAASHPNDLDHQLVGYQYVPDQQCADCHQDIWDTFQHVGMAKSAYEFDANEAIEDFKNNHYFHEPSNKHYEMTVEEGQFVMTRYRLRKDGVRTAVLKQTADFIIGSGNHARTYCYRDPTGGMYQLPVVWYSQESKWAMAPGYDHAKHDDFIRPIPRECMFCHNAYPNYETGSDTFLMPDRFSQELPHGIGCQRCHGPGSEHIRVAELDLASPDVLTTIVNPANLEDQLRDDVCNQCHFQPSSGRTSFMRSFDRGVYSFQPGQRLAEYQSYYELADAEATDLFEVNHHPYRLYQSKCYISSKGSLSCLTCHNPHAKVAEQDRVSYYRERCLECHGKNDCLDVERGRQPESDCIQCHMPTRRTDDVVHMTMTDHKIVRRSGLDDPLAPRKEVKLPADHPIKNYTWLRAADDSIKPLQEVGRSVARLLDSDMDSIGRLYGQIQSGITNADEPKIQLAQTMLGLDENSAALNLLDAVSESGKRSSLVQTNLGLGFMRINQMALAIKYLEKAVTLPPVRPEAHFNLAVAYNNSGDLKRAVEQYEKAVELQPNLAAAWFNLASTLTKDEKLKLAEKNYQRALQIDPDYQGAHLALAHVQRLQEKYLESVRTLEDGQLSHPKDIAIAKERGLTTLEAVSRQMIEASKSLESVQALGTFKQPNGESTVMLAVALLQNGLNDDAMQAIGPIDEAEQDPDRLLVAAIGQANSNQADSAMKLYQIAKRQLENRSQPPTRLRTLILQMADKVVGKVRSE